MANYNGWKNYETWDLKLWIDNEEASYNYYRKLARDLQGDITDRTYELSTIIKEEVMENIPETTGFYADILMKGLEEIDYYEIAENIVSEVYEEE